MADNISYGFLRPQDSDFSDISLSVECGNEVATLSFETDARLATELTSWGRGNNILVKGELSTDLSTVITDCDLPSTGARLGALLRWNCPTTSIRGYGDTVPLTDGVTRPIALIPGNQIAGAVSPHRTRTRWHRPSPEACCGRVFCVSTLRESARLFKPLPTISRKATNVIPVPCGGSSWNLIPNSM